MRLSRILGTFECDRRGRDGEKSCRGCQKIYKRSKSWADGFGSNESKGYVPGASELCR